MKKRILSLTLALLFCLGLAAPAGLVIPAEAAVNASDAQAYLDILDRTNPTDSFLIDFDGDGRDELLTVSTLTHYNTYDAYYSIWQGSKSVVTDEQMVLVMLPFYDVCTKGGKTYIRQGMGLTFGADYDCYTVENGQWTKEVSFSDKEVDEGNFEYSPSYTVNGREVSETEYIDAFRAYQVQFSICPGDDPRHGNARPQLEEIVQAEALKNATPEEILAQIPYYGDRSKCRLTSEQAEQMVGALENWTGDTDWAGTGRYICSYLVDGDGSGIPVLVVVSEVYEGSELVLDWLDIYSWGSGGLKKDNLTSSYMGVYGHNYCSFGKFPNGQYGWNDDYGHMGYSSFASYTLQSGTLMKNFSCDSNAFDPYSTDETAYLTINDQTVIELKYKDAGGDLDLWEQWLEEIWEKYVNSVAPYKLAETISYKTGIGKNQMISLLRAYADAKKFPTYTYTQAETGDKHYSDVAGAVSGQGTIQAIYRLLEDAYYVLLENNGVYTGAVVRGLRENGSPVWKVTQTDGEPAAEDALGQLVNRLAAVANLHLDYGKLRGSPELADLTDYLREVLKNIDGLAPNDPAKSELAVFLDSAVTALASGSAAGKDNRLTLGSEELTGLASTAQSTLGTLNRVLQDNGVELNKTLQPVIRVLWSGIDKDKACQLTLNRDTVKSLTGCDLQVLLGDAQTYIRITPEGLSTLINELESLSIQILQEEPGIYDIRFLDGDGQVVERLSRPVTIGLSAPNEMSTIIATYIGGSDNWGGQYDAVSGTISFETSFSGRYEVLENSVTIDDIGELSEESQAAIAFMVSKGYFAVEDGLFRPGDSLTRYEFTEALVGMFFALDRSLTSSFPDVPGDSSYYPYVASAQARDIVRGLGDGTFSGESNITREQVFALAARTLIDQKGYSQPADVDSYLGGYFDRDAISDWAADLVALSVREGVASRGAALIPQADITREQAAVVLYRLFQLLYEVSPVALDMPEAATTSSGAPSGLGIVAVTAGLAAVGLGAVLVLKKKGMLSKTTAAVTSTVSQAADQTKKDGE